MDAPPYVIAIILIPVILLAIYIYLEFSGDGERPSAGFIALLVIGLVLLWAVTSDGGGSSGSYDEECPAHNPGYGC